MVLFLALGLFSFQSRAETNTNQFLFLTLRFKTGVVTLEKAEIVSGTLKPQPNSTEERPLLISLEQSVGDTRWSVAIDDPSIQRLEYEDPQQRGVIKSKVIPVDDIEFIVRAPLIPGVRQLAIHRKEIRSDPAAAAAPATNSLLARIELPNTVTK